MEIIISHFQRYQAQRVRRFAKDLPAVTCLGQNVASRFYPNVLTLERHFLIAKLTVPEETFSFIRIVFSKVSVERKLCCVVWDVQ